MSSGGIADYMWSGPRGYSPGLSIIEIGERRHGRRDTAFSFENRVMAELAGEIVGVAHSCVMPEPNPRKTGDKSDPVLAPYDELEVPGSLHISSTAVDPTRRDPGLGARLLAETRGRARALGCPSLSLIAFEENAAAIRLYEREGFKRIDQRSVVSHPPIQYAGEATLMVAALMVAAAA